MVGSRGRSAWCGSGVGGVECVRPISGGSGDGAVGMWCDGDEVAYSGCGWRGGSAFGAAACMCETVVK